MKLSLPQMFAKASSGHVAAAPRLARQCPPPAWAADLVKGASGRWLEAPGMTLRVTCSGSFALASLRVPGAVDLTPVAFERVVTEAYELIFRQSQIDGAAWHPVRLWNHIPCIH